MSQIADELKQMRQAKWEKIKTTYVPDWEAQLPEGSLWSPGSEGQPDCKKCLGLGWLRRDLPIDHKEFGKLIMCSCVSREDHFRLMTERGNEGKRPE